MMHHIGGPIMEAVLAAFRFCMDALNQNKVELAKGNEAQHRQDEMRYFLRKYNVDETFCWVLPPTFSRRRPEFAQLQESLLADNSDWLVRIARLLARPKLGSF